MKYIVLILIFIFACILFNLSICRKEETAHTVDWYKSHDIERKSLINTCHNNPGEVENSQDCINSEKAEIAIDAEKRGGLKLEPLSKEEFNKIKN